MTVDPKTLAVYNAKAAEYAATFDNGGKPRSHLARFMGKLPNGARVLDLGCGPGGSSYLMMQAGFDVDAIDASSEMELRGLLTDAGLDIVAQDVGHEVGLAGTDDWWIVLMAEKKANP